MGINFENDRVWYGDNCNNMTTNNLTDEQSRSIDLPSREGELRRGRPLGGELPPGEWSSRQPPPRPHLVADPLDPPRHHGAVKSFSVKIAQYNEGMVGIISLSPHFHTLRAIAVIKKTKLVFAGVLVYFSYVFPLNSRERAAGRCGAAAE